MEYIAPFAALLMAFGYLFNIYITLQAKWAVERQGENIQKIELATNSMKDALVVASEKAARSEGREEAHAEAKVEAKELAGVVAAAVVAREDVAAKQTVTQTGGPDAG